MITKRNSLVLFALPLMILGPGIPARSDDQEAQIRYSNCMAMAERSPDKGINQALVWRQDGGGVPARHCEAVGLFHLGEYAESAARLMKIAEDMRVGRDMPLIDGKPAAAAPAVLADIYDQAANAWLLADELIRADDALAMALSLVPAGSVQEREFLIDRARLAARDGDYDQALKDMSTVQAADPGRVDILILIASAARGVGQYARAEEALDKYLAVNPDDSAAWLERGNLFHAQDQKAEARKAWLKVVQINETGPDADAARANLEKLDLKVEPEVESKPKSGAKN